MVIVFHLVKQTTKPLGFLFLFVLVNGTHCKTFKTLLLQEITAIGFQTFKLRALTKLRWVSDFYQIYFEHFKFPFVPYGETKTLNYLENERL